MSSGCGMTVMNSLSLWLGPVRDGTSHQFVTDRRGLWTADGCWGKVSFSSMVYPWLRCPAPVNNPDPRSFKQLSLNPASPIQMMGQCLRDLLERGETCGRVRETREVMWWGVKTTQACFIYMRKKKKTQRIKRNKQQQQKQNEKKKFCPGCKLRCLSQSLFA